MGEVPKDGGNYEPIKSDNYKFSILEVKDHRIEKVKIELIDGDMKNA